MRIGIMLIALSTITGVCEAAERSVSIRAEDGFVLKADYQHGEGPGPGVLLLHQCNSDRTMWMGLAQKLAARGMHVLSLDYRGFGQSREGEYSQRMAPRISDVRAAFEFLRNQEGVEPRFGLGGASCGGNMEILLAAGEEDVKTMVFLSSQISSQEAWNAFEDLRDLPALVIAAEDDGNTTSSLRRLFEQSESKDTRLILYKGGAHGYPLFRQDPNLERVIAEWYADRLPK